MMAVMKSGDFPPCEVCVIGLGAMGSAAAWALAQRGLSGVRLSCQVLCDRDMTVRAVSRLEGSGRPDPGPLPADEIDPPPTWVPR